MFAFLTGLHAGSAEPVSDTSFFEQKIRPVLAKHCYECHSAESGKQKGGLRLDTKHGLRIGGDSGPAVIPGDPGKSLLLSAIKHTDPDLKMPPERPPLPGPLIMDFETWIKSGAPDPRESPADKPQRSAATPHWSHQVPLIPKKRGPDQWAPVISFAIAVSEA